MRWLGALHLLFLPLLVLPADEAVVSNVGFQPQEFFVGDRVIMTVQVTVAGAGEPVIPPLPLDNGKIIIEGIDIQGTQDQYLMVIIFRSFVPGSVEFPLLDFETFQLSGLSIYTTPLVENPVELRSLRGQLLLPGTRLYSGLILLFVLALPIILYFLVRFILRSGVYLLGNYQKKKPYRRLIRVIRRLDTGLPQWDNKMFYIMLIDGLRDYLAGKTGLGFTTATTSEIRHMGKRVLPEREIETIVQLMSLGDRVKFAGEEVSGDDRKASLDEVIRLAEELELKEAPDADV